MDQLNPEQTSPHMSRCDSQGESQSPSPSKPSPVKNNPLNSPSIPTTSTSTRDPHPMDGQPRIRYCQTHDTDQPCSWPGIANCPRTRPTGQQAGPDTPIDGPLAAVPFDAKGGTSRDDLHGLTVAARERGLARLRFAIAWCGPWERFEAWLLAIDCGSRDLAWQRRHVERGTTPARWWRRKAGAR